MPGYARAHGSRLVKGGRRGFGVGATPTPPPSGSTIQTFTVAHEENTANDGLLTFGLVFDWSDMPTGSVPVIKRDGSTIPAQFDRKVTMGSSQRFMLAAIRDPWTANGTRTYTVEAAVGSYDNTSDYDLAQLALDYDFNTVIANAVDWELPSSDEQTAPSSSVGARWFDSISSNPTPSTLPASPVEVRDHAHRIFNVNNETLWEWVPASSAWTEITSTPDNTRAGLNGTYSLNTALADSAKRRKVRSGPICDEWEVWQEMDGGVRGYHYVTVYKDAGGNAAFAEYYFALEQTKWKATDKALIRCDITVRNGSTVLQSYTGAFCPNHTTPGAPYGGDDVHEGKPCRVGAAQDQFAYRPDRWYWTKAGYLPPNDWDFTPTPAATTNGTDGPYTDRYKPAFGINMRGDTAGESQGGGYGGRWMIHNVCTIGLTLGTCADHRAMRLTGYADMGLANHLRDDTTNTIKTLNFGTSADPANYNAAAWQSAGLPAPVDYAYERATTSTPKDSFGPRSGGQAFRKREPIENTHHVDNEFTPYLLFGYPWFLRAHIDLFNGNLHKDDNRANSATFVVVDNSSNGEDFRARFWYNNGQSSRAMGWAAMRAAHTYAICPDDAPERQWVTDVFNHNADYLKQAVDAQPAEQKAWGLWHYVNQYNPPWMETFVAMGVAHAYNITGNADLLYAMEASIGKHIDNFVARGVEYAEDYRAAHMAFDRSSSNYWNGTTRVMTPPVVHPAMLHTYNITSGSANIVSQSSSGPRPIFTVGDIVQFTYDGATIPAEVSYFTNYYVVAVSGGDNRTIQISATEGGSAITFGSTISGVSLGLIENAYLSALTAPDSQVMTIENGDMRGAMAWAASMLLEQAGVSYISEADTDAFATLYGNFDYSDWPARKVARPSGGWS